MHLFSSISFQSILPTPERIQMFQYLYGMPIQMTAYGHRISYGTMGTVLAAVMAAFASKILLQEMNLIIKWEEKVEVPTKVESTRLVATRACFINIDCDFYSSLCALSTAII